MVKLKVVTWNLENLFQAGDRSGPKTPEAYQQKLTSLAQVILQLDPDILGVQEVGALQAFAELTDLLDGRYPHMKLSNFPDRRGIRVGFLSKLPIEEQEDIKYFPVGSLVKVTGYLTEENSTEIVQMGRGAVRILVKPKPDLSLNLINVHFKSKLLSYPSFSDSPRFTPINENERAQVAGYALLKRIAEAIAIRVKANELIENNNAQGLIVLGDLNDVTDAATTQILQGPNGSEIGSRGFNRPDQGDDSRLFNLAPLIDSERCYSRIFRSNKELIDHIFVSQELLPGQPRKLPTVDSHVDFAETIPSIGDDPRERRGKPGSDHAPISAIFDL